MRKTAVLGMLTCAALMLSWAESFLPIAPTIPGIRLGLANMMVVFCLYRFGWREAAMINAARILLSAFLFGNFSVLLYSTMGAVCAFFVMLLMKQSGLFSTVGVSIGGGVIHNMAQLLLAMVIVQTVQISFYLPWLLASGCLTGLFNGVAANAADRLLPKRFTMKE
ncbi:MAG: Gx transporter family protein [Lachnospiraceae bacterium]|nr:Gx transporter family protein [Lachnospiraceae bacterium]